MKSGSLEEKKDAGSISSLLSTVKPVILVRFLLNPDEKYSNKQLPVTPN